MPLYNGRPISRLGTPGRPGPPRREATPTPDVISWLSAAHWTFPSQAGTNIIFENSYESGLGVLFISISTMGAFYETIPKSLIEWILAQKMFWVASAPLAGSGHVNISPKGGEYFGILDERTFWYMDLTGSGSETIAHLYEQGNGRITVMFNAFDGQPRILRLFGKGKVLESGTGPFDDFVKKHDVKTIPGTRAIMLVDVHQVGSSCGFSVPFYDFKEHRPVLNEFFARKEAKYRDGNEKESLPRQVFLFTSLA